MVQHPTAIRLLGKIIVGWQSDGIGHSLAFLSECRQRGFPKGRTSRPIFKNIAPLVLWRGHPAVLGEAAACNLVRPAIGREQQNKIK
jgi:hypothetical protein